MVEAIKHTMVRPSTIINHNDIPTSNNNQDTVDAKSAKKIPLTRRGRPGNIGVGIRPTIIVPLHQAHMLGAIVLAIVRREHNLALAHAHHGVAEADLHRQPVLRQLCAKILVEMRTE